MQAAAILRRDLANGTLSRRPDGGAARVEEAAALEARDDGGLGRNDTPCGGRSIHHDLVGQAVHEVHRRDAPVGEAREIDGAGIEIEERRPESETGILLAETARPV